MKGAPSRIARGGRTREGGSVTWGGGGSRLRRGRDARPARASGLGANYQTASVAVILAGRQSFGIFLSVPFMKNIELPLMTLVAVYELAATGRPVAAAATLAVVVAFVLFWRRNRVDWRKEPGDEKTKQRRKKRESLRMSFVGSEPLTLKEIHDSLRGDDGESAAMRREDKAD